MDPSRKGTRRFIIEDILVMLVALAVGKGVDHLKGIVDMLFPVDKCHAVKVGFAILPVEEGFQVVSHHPPVEGNSMTGDPGIPFLPEKNRMYRSSTIMLVLH